MYEITLSPLSLKVIGKITSGSAPDPYLLIREKTVRSGSDLVRSGSVATSAIDSYNFKETLKSNFEF